MAEYCLNKFHWTKIDQWENDYFTRGMYIKYEQKYNKFIDSDDDEVHAIILPSFRYGIAFEIYGILGELAASNLGISQANVLQKKLVGI